MLCSLQRVLACSMLLCPARGETRQWLVGSPEFRNTYTMHLGRSCFVILNKHMRAADILLLIAADRKKFRNHMIEHMAFRTHMGTHDICAQRCPPFQRFAPALARSQKGVPHGCSHGMPLGSMGGGIPPITQMLRRTTDITSRGIGVCERRRVTNVPSSPPRIASGGGLPRPWAAHSTPPTTARAWSTRIAADRPPWPNCVTRDPPRAPVPPT